MEMLSATRAIRVRRIRETTPTLTATAPESTTARRLTTRTRSIRMATGSVTHARRQYRRVATDWTTTAIHLSIFRPTLDANCPLCGASLLLGGKATLTIKGFKKLTSFPTVDALLGDHTWTATDGIGLDYAGQYAELNKNGTNVRFALNDGSLSVVVGGIEDSVAAATGRSVSFLSISQRSASLKLNRQKTIAKVKVSFAFSVLADGTARSGTYTLTLQGPLVR